MLFAAVGHAGKFCFYFAGAGVAAGYDKLIAFEQIR